MYLDSAYIAKFYLNEPDSLAVREVLAGADTLVSSVWALGEVCCAFRRHLREGSLDSRQYGELQQAFLEDVAAGIWTLAPVTERLLHRMASMLGAIPTGAYVRAGDALHLTTAQDLGELDIWSSDRHVLAAAKHFGLIGRRV